MIHKVYKSRQGVIESKRHHWELIMTIPSSQICFRYIIIFHPKVVISQTLMNFRKVTCQLEFIKQTADPKKKILIVYRDLIELMVINAHPKGPILILNKQTKIPHGEILGFMKTLYNKSLSLTFSSFDSARAIW